AVQPLVLHNARVHADAGPRAVRVDRRVRPVDAHGARRGLAPASAAMAVGHRRSARRARDRGSPDAVELSTAGPGLARVSRARATATGAGDRDAVLRAVALLFAAYDLHADVDDALDAAGERL